MLGPETNQGAKPDEGAQLQPAPNQDPATNAGSVITNGEVKTDHLPGYTDAPHPQRKRGIGTAIGVAAAVVAAGVGSFFVGRSGAEGDKVTNPEPTELPGLPGQPTEQSTPSTEAPTTSAPEAETPGVVFETGTQRMIKTSTGDTVFYSSMPGRKASIFLDDEAKAEMEANKDLSDMGQKVYAETIEVAEQNNKLLPRAIGECVVYKEYTKKDGGQPLPFYSVFINPTKIVDKSNPSITTYRAASESTSYPLSVQDLGNGNYRVPFGIQEFSVIKLPGSKVVDVAILQDGNGKSVKPDKYRWGDTGQVVNDEADGDPTRMSIVDAMATFGSDDPNFSMSDEQKQQICADLYAQTNAQRYIEINS